MPQAGNPVLHNQKQNPTVQYTFEEFYIESTYLMDLDVMLLRKWTRRDPCVVDSFVVEHLRSNVEHQRSNLELF